MIKRELKTIAKNATMENQNFFIGNKKGMGKYTERKVRGNKMRSRVQWAEQGEKKILSTF